jgi:biopolymer transport protein ExbD
MSNRRKKKRFGKRHFANEDMVLQITSMADIFTIILVFLLKSFATGAASITPSQDMMLPEAVAGDTMTETTKIEISSKSVAIDDKVAATLNESKFNSGDLESDGTARSLNTAFRKALQDLQTKRSPASATTSAPVNPVGAKQDPGLLVMADREVPYTTIKTVLDTAAQNGYGEFKLVVVEDK